MAYPFINNFNAGELSPLVDARSDIDKYYSGCRVMENMVPLVEGGATRMPGTYYVTTTKTQSEASRLIPFQFSTTQAYVLEFGEEYIRFYMDEGQILSGLNPYEISTPYQEDELFELKVFQSADIMWICHPSHPTKELTRTAHTTWTLTDHLAKVGDEMEITDITQANPAVVTCTTVPTTLEAGDIVYIEDVTGMTEVNDLFFTVASVTTGAAGHFQLVGINSTTYTAYGAAGTAQECLYGTEDNCPSCGTFFEQRLMLGGSNNYPQRLDGSASADFNDFDLGDEDDDAIQFTIASTQVDRILWMVGQDYLLLGTVGGVWKAGASSTSEPITQTNISIKKFVTIGAKNIAPEVVTDSLLWVSRGGTSVRKLGYSLEEDRNVAVDMTRIAKHIAKGSTSSTSGIKQMAFQREPTPILWAVRNDGELLGLTYETQEKVFAWFRVVTDGGAFESVAVIGDEDEEEQIWAIVLRTIDGSTARYVEYFKPFDFYHEIDDCFFLHSGLSWTGTSAATITGITQANPAVVTAESHGFTDGELVRISGVVGMTEANQGLTHAYTVAGATADTFQLSGITSAGWSEYTSGGTAIQVIRTVTGLDHLEGEDVDILIDGAVAPAETVSGGEITMDWYGNKVHVGLGCASTLEPMKLAAGDRNSTTKTRKQKISRLHAMFYETRGGKAGPDTDNLKIIPVGTGGTPELITDTITFEFDGDWRDEATLVLYQDQPLPMTVLGIVPEYFVEK